MIQLVAITYNDDTYASKDIDVMVCSSIDTAKETILNNINKKFDGEWDSLESAANELTMDLENAIWIENEKKFAWHDNGKGEEYMIAEIEIMGNDNFQHVGTIY